MAANEIKAWFQQHEDGEFTFANPTAPLVHCGTPETAKSIVYCTKPHCLPRVRTLGHLPAPLAAIGRYGLPLDDRLDAIWGASPAERYFLGDADPVDLFIFAWMRQRWRIRWIGVSDEFLTHHDTRQFTWIKMALSEAEADAVLQLPVICADYCDFLGSYCSSLLEAGYKIELEGATTPPPGSR